MVAKIYGLENQNFRQNSISLIFHVVFSVVLKSQLMQNQAMLQ